MYPRKYCQLANPVITATRGRRVLCTLPQGFFGVPNTPSATRTRPALAPTRPRDVCSESRAREMSKKKCAARAVREVAPRDFNLDPLNMVTIVMFFGEKWRRRRSCQLPLPFWQVMLVWTEIREFLLCRQSWTNLKMLVMMYHMWRAWFRLSSVTRCPGKSD